MMEKYRRQLMGERGLEIGYLYFQMGHTLCVAFLFGTDLQHNLT